MNQIESKSQTLHFKHKPAYNGLVFNKDGKNYRYLGGTWLMQNNEALDAIRFEQIIPPNERDEPIPTFIMEEQEFFSKVKIF